MAGSIPASVTPARPADLGRTTVVPDDVGPVPRRPWRRSGAWAGVLALLVVVVVGVLAPSLAPHDPLQPVGPALAAPSPAFPFGTDGLGRDLLSGVVHGARTSTVVVAGTGMVAVLVGVAVGALAGFSGRRVDDLLMRLTEIVQVLPRFFVALVVVALWGPGLDRLVLVLGLTSWTVIARICRAEVLSVRSREFVDASRAVGASWLRVLARQVLPNVLPSVIAYAGLVLAHALLLEASLAFLGLGDPSVVSWGYLAGQAQRFLRVAWWLSLFPGTAIVVTAVALNLVGEGLSAWLRTPWDRRRGVPAPAAPARRGRRRAAGGLRRRRGARPGLPAPPARP